MVALRELKNYNSTNNCLFTRKTHGAIKIIGLDKNEVAEHVKQINQMIINPIISGKLSDGSRKEVNPTTVTYLEKELGKTKFVKVVEGQYDNSEVAIKVFLDKNLDLSLFVEEVQVLFSLTHSNIATLLAYVLEPKPAMIMPLYPNNLSDLITSNIVDIQTKKNLAKDIITGLIFLHTKNMPHNNLKPQNILITKDLHAVISDIGISKLIKEKQKVKDKNEN